MITEARMLKRATNCADKRIYCIKCYHKQMNQHFSKDNNWLFKYIYANAYYL